METFIKNIKKQAHLLLRYYNKLENHQNLLMKKYKPNIMKVLN